MKKTAKNLLFFRKAIFAGIITGFIILSGTFIRAVEITEGRVGSWKFDEGTGTTAADTSGYGNNGIIYGANWVDGVKGGALYFDGADDYVFCGSNSSLSASTFTISAWISSAGDPKFSGIISKRQPEQYWDNYGLYWNNSKAHTSFYSATINSWFGVASSSTLNANNWYHLAATYDGAVMKIYINGVLDNSNSGVHTPMIGDYLPVVIGTDYYDSANRAFKGKIDGVAIYNRVLTEEEIETIAIYNPPSLTWTGEQNYTTDGLDPAAGTSTMTYVYRVKYTNPDNDAPKSGYPKVHIKKNGAEISGGPFAMNYISGDYNTGAIYSFSKELILSGTDYVYYFEAYDIWNTWAIGVSTVSRNGPDITDTTPPNVSFSYLQDNITISKATDVVVNATDNGQIGKVQFYVDNVIKSTDTTAPYSWGWDTTAGYSDGQHAVKAVAYDTAGNTSSATVNVNVEYELPSIPQITFPTNNYITNQVTMTITGTADYKNQVQVYVNNTLVGDGYAGSNNSFSIPNVPFSVGVNTITVNVWDGKPTMRSSSPIKVTVDNVFPASRVLPLQGTNSPPEIILQWEPTNNTTDIVSYTIKYQYTDTGGNISAWQSLLSGTTLTTIAFTGQENYTYRFLSIARDAAENEEQKTSQDTYTQVKQPYDYLGRNVVISSNKSWNGEHINIGNFIVTKDATLSIVPYDGIKGGSVTIQAQSIQVDGTIDGNAKGYRAGGDWSQNGEGPGGGNHGTGNYAPSGGGYGGVGGKGKDNAGELTIIGGSSYGNVKDEIIEMGSGAGGPVTINYDRIGRGGAAMKLIANSVIVNGSINANGQNGALITYPGEAPAAGGSGGGILFNASTIILSTSSIIKANGGNGLINPSYKYSGGGGGGRIKFFTTTLSTGGIVEANGGTAATGQEGQAGTIYSTVGSFAPPKISTITLSDSSPAKAGDVIFTLSFTKEMDVSSQPVVTFGLASPYNTRNVTGYWQNSSVWLGSFTITDTTGDGLNTLSVSALSSAGAPLDPNPDTSFNFTIDTVKPAAIANLTALSQPAGRINLSWTAPTGNPVAYNVYRSTAEITGISGLTPVNNTNQLYYIDTPATDGTYYYVTTALDSAYNESDISNCVNAVSDRVPPESVTDLEANITGSTVTLTWTQPEGETPALYKVYRALFEITAGNITSANLRGSTTNQTYSESFPGDGTYYYAVTCLDGIGNTSNPSNSPAATYDTTPPTAGITINPVSPVQAGNVQITLVTSEPVISSPTLSYKPYQKSEIPVELSGSQTNWSGIISINAATGDGTAAFIFSATDYYSNVGSTITSGSTFVIDTTSPPAPTNLSWTHETTGDIKLSWNYSGETATFNLYRSTNDITATDNLTPIKTNVTQQNTLDFPPGNEDVWYYAVTSKDTAGNESNVSVSTSIAMPLKPIITSPSSGITVNTPVITVSGIAQPGVIVEVFVGNESKGIVTATSPRNFSMNIQFNLGSNIIKAKAGNSLEYTQPVTVTLDTIPQTVSGLTATAGDTVITLNWTQSAESDVVGYNVYRDNGLTPLNYNIIPKNQPTFMDIGLTDGKIYTYTVSVIDNLNQEGTKSSPIQVVPQAGIEWGGSQ